MAAIDAFSAKLAQLADLSDDELGALESEVMAAFDQADEAENVEDMEQLADALEQVRAERSKRGENANPDEAAPVESAAEAIEASGTNNEDPEPEAVSASGDDNTDNEKEKEDMAVKVPEDRAPKAQAEKPVNAIVASVDVPGYSAGTEFKDMAALSDAFANRVNTLNKVRGGDGERVSVASITASVSEDRILRMNDPEGNREKIKAVTDLSAITAAGGFCAPLSTRYDLFTIGETSRPVRDSLAGFQADRGGIRFYTAPTLSTLGTATGRWDTAADAAYDPADEGTWKVCGTIDCPDEQTAETEAITSCLTFGVMHSRVFPENVEANTRLAMVNHARIAESVLLSKIKAGSTALAGPAVSYGAVRDVLLTVARVGAWYRDRHRLDRDVPLRAILPLWLLEILRSDIIVQPPAGDGRTADFAISNNDVENFFDQWGISITWALDGPDPLSNAGGTYGPLVGDALPAFPTEVEWGLYAEGSWLFLDGGNLDLGIIRDSKLVRSNDYTQFSETFEGAAKLGGESLWITSPVEVRGGYSPAIAAPVVTP